MKSLGLLLCASALCLGGCAGEIVRRPVEVSPIDQQTSKKYISTQQVSINLDSGYRRTIEAGAEFVGTGKIKEGVVLKPTNTVFTIEGAHMHEAYPVLEAGRIVGFYLPVERAFSPLSQPVSFQVQERSR